MPIIQDMPPPGGYPPVRYKRIPAKVLFNGPILIGIYLTSTIIGIYLYSLNYKKIKKRSIELRSSKMAIYPMLLAERDRAFMKQLRINRQEEDELMKDYEGWVTGTYYGERVYNMLPKDTLVTPIFHDYYMHSSPREWFRRAYIKLRS